MHTQCRNVEVYTQSRTCTLRERQREGEEERGGWRREREGARQATDKTDSRDKIQKRDRRPDTRPGQTRRDETRRDHTADQTRSDLTGQVRPDQARQTGRPTDHGQCEGDAVRRRLRRVSDGRHPELVLLQAGRQRQAEAGRQTGRQTGR